MEFDLATFTQTLRDKMVDRFPKLDKRGENPSGSPKHGQYNEMIVDVAFKNNPTILVGEKEYTFDIGNEYSEEHYPYYHILEDAPYIRKRNRGTTKTRGSQANVEKGKRDYGVVSWNGKTFTKEYQRNVRGTRNRLDKVSHWITNDSGEKEFINRESNTYKNEHYQYIEKMLDIITIELASEFNLKKARVEKTGFEEELAMQWGIDSSTILDIFQSFE